MAWTRVAHRGAASNKVNGTTLSVNPTATLAAGAIVAAFCAADNIGTTNDVSFEHHVTDSKGNTWYRAYEQRRGAGSAAAGVTASLFLTRITTAILPTDTVTLTLRSARTAKVISLEEFAVGAGNTFRIEGRAGAHGASTAPSVTHPTVHAEPRLWLGFVAIEGPNEDTFTQDADYTTLTNTGTTGGTATDNVSIRNGYRVASLPTDIYNPTLGTSRDWAAILVGLTEVPLPPGPSTRASDTFSSDNDPLPSPWARLGSANADLRSLNGYATASVLNTDAAAYHTANHAKSRQWARVTLVRGTGTIQMGPAIRASDESSGGRMLFLAAEDTQYVLYDAQPGAAFTPIGPAYPVAPANGDVLELRVGAPPHRPNYVEGLVNGKVVVAGTPSGYVDATPTRTGMYVQTSSTSNGLDNFESGDYGIAHLSHIATVNPGVWVEVVTENLSAVLDDALSPGKRRVIFNVSGRWDGGRSPKRIHYLSGDDPGTFKHVSYRDDTNTWEYMPDGPWFPSPPSNLHLYDHLSLDESGGYLYYETRRYNLNTATWDTTDEARNWPRGAWAESYWPGKGRAVCGTTTDGAREVWYKPDGGSWTQVPGTYSFGQQHMLLSYSPAVDKAVFGGGDSNNTFYIWHADNSITPLPGTPPLTTMNVNTCMVTSDPVSGKWLFILTAGDVYEHDGTATGFVYLGRIVDLTTPNPDWWFKVDVPTYKCIVLCEFVAYRVSRMWAYRHTAAPATAASFLPTRNRIRHLVVR